MTSRRQRLAVATAAAWAILSSPPASAVAGESLSADGAAVEAAAVATARPASSSVAEVPGTPFRVFQALPFEPSSLSPAALSRMHRSIRATQAMIFSPSNRHHSDNGGVVASLPDDGVELALDVYAPSERREYLVRRGNRCHPRGTAGAVGGGPGGPLDDEGASSLQWYDVLSRYDSLMAAGSGGAPASEGDRPGEGGDGGGSPGSKRGAGADPAGRAGSPELERMAVELFKFCVLSNGDGHAFLGWEEQLLLPFRDAVDLSGNYGVVGYGAGKPDSGGSELVVGGLGAGTADGAGSVGAGGAGGGAYVHESFLSISPYAPAASELSAMIRLLLETPDDVLAFDPMLLPLELHRLISGRVGNVPNSNAGGAENDSSNSEKGDGSGNSASWTLLRNGCIPLAGVAGGGASPPPLGTGGDDGAGTPFASFELDPNPASATLAAPDRNAHRVAARCPLSQGGYCCLAFSPDKGGSGSLPVMALRHPGGGQTPGGAGGSAVRLPYKLARAREDEGVASRAYAAGRSALGGVPASDLPYVSTVRLVRDDARAAAAAAPESPAARFPTHPADSPNFFDILFENDCLPYRKECHRCLKDAANEAPAAARASWATARAGGACVQCRLECPCYCDVLCKVRPPPKPVARTYTVRPPALQKEAGRLVPRIVHQTWFEPVMREKYPNMSRLIESWKKSGWEYYFYDDDAAGEFLGVHFPPEVREAYESITPGAFKADLFRYCVLLIRGGVYADMDVLLETNLDDAVANDIGFMTPIDEPGIQVGHRSCLWNGLIASAPGHPFLARTIEIVVNNIRNRFTAVDYDDMLCPNPILSVSHTVDTLFTCGPCILGAGINNLLGRHMQAEFDIGDVDIWQSERLGNDAAHARPDDPRLLVPGRTVILEQNKNDMGAHRFTWADRHLIIATTDMPDYDERPLSKEHYSKTHEKAGVYGMRKLYTDTKRANEEIRIVVER